MRSVVTAAQVTCSPWRAESTRILTTMGTLSYGMITSLDGYAEGPDGRFDWATPDESTHRFVNEREREFGTYLYGRRLFKTMQVWAEDDWLEGRPDVLHEYADIWRDRDKVDLLPHHGRPHARPHPARTHPRL